MSRDQSPRWARVKVWIYRSGLVTALLALFMLLTGPLRTSVDQSGSASPEENADQSASEESVGSAAAVWPETEMLGPVERSALGSGGAGEDDAEDGGVWTSEQQAALAQRIQDGFDEDTDGWGTLAVYAADAQTGAVVVEINAEEPMVAASTYKLFVAYSMIRAVEEGQWSWDEPLLSGLSLGECFEIMITESDNACPVAWLNTVGPEAVQAEVDELGLTHTTVAWRHMETTAADLGSFLQALLAAEGITDGDRDRLLALMEVQEFREGVPAGVTGEAVVANKVGFLEELLHDAAIIRESSGDTILVVMTANASWEAIANVTSVFQSER